MSAVTEWKSLVSLQERNKELKPPGYLEVSYH